MATITSFEDIQAWKAASQLQRLVYRATQSRSFDHDRRLRDQMRAAAVSVMSNIAEGFERGGNKEFGQFLAQAKGSVGELKAQIHAALNAEYITQAEFEAMIRLATDTERLIGGFMRYLRSSEIRGPKFK